jgi:ubiquinone biosynthesis protein COQ4
MQVVNEREAQVKFNDVKALEAFITMTTNEGGTEAVDKAVFDLGEMLTSSRAYELVVEQMQAEPSMAELLQERYVGAKHDLETLLQYPKNSFGYIYANTMKELGLSLDYLPGVNIDSDTSYIEYRWRQTHDIWHIITGFDISEVGELGLQAFYLAQFGLPFSGLVVASGLVGTILYQPEDTGLLLDAISRGWQMGKQAKPLIAQKWEEMWEKPLFELRQELNVVVTNNK